jgi:hypothetical protein
MRPLSYRPVEVLDKRYRGPYKRDRHSKRGARPRPSLVRDSDHGRSQLDKAKVRAARDHLLPRRSRLPVDIGPFDCTGAHLVAGLPRTGTECHTQYVKSSEQA